MIASPSPTRLSSRDDHITRSFVILLLAAKSVSSNFVSAPGNRSEIHVSFAKILHVTVTVKYFLKEHSYSTTGQGTVYGKIFKPTNELMTLAKIIFSKLKFTTGLKVFS